MQGRRIQITGTVQGVGFRPWVYRLARAAGLAGQVRNDASGVTIDAFGPEPDLERFLERLRTEAPAAASIANLKVREIEAEPPGDFSIVASQAAAPAERQPSIPPDLATCPECVAEVLAPSDRRHGYAFTNCTSCGPRFTIALDVPYDRPATTMAAFEMCPACRREYESPEDRRFHAQPNACPACGPRLRFLSPSGQPLDAEADPIAAAARLLIAGGIVAIKGLGGYHLACDATSEKAVATLRLRKHREEKPFAVMAPDLAVAERLAWLDAPSRRLLASVESPIVLVPRRPGATIAASVAPGGTRLGLLLPYTPLQHLLLAATGRPLVMTSGNRSEEPIAFRDEDALDRLATIADAFLSNDRPIASRTDDSVATVIAGRPVVLRRSRGYVPRPIEAPRRFARPVLACGAQLKNTFCLAKGPAAWLGAHVGDLDDLATYDGYRDAIGRMERFAGVRPELIAHDLHPGYLSTRYALERAREPGVRAVAVQHHHAHVAAAMGEHRLAGPVLGLAYDGTGLGTDGTSWGAELLRATYGRFERLATWRPIPLPGGDEAIRQPWRVALALLEDAFAGDAPLDRLALFATVPRRRLDVVRRMIAQHVHAPLAHGMGRLFDAAGAIGLVRPLARHEGQVAIAWDEAADPTEHGMYLFAIDRSVQPWIVDPRPMVRSMVKDLLDGVAPAIVSARFHETVIAATVELIHAAGRELGRLPVVLSGGSFANARLAAGVARSLRPGWDVYLHERVPPGDGGLALGQALVADAIARGEG